MPEPRRADSGTMDAAQTLADAAGAYPLYGSAREDLRQAAEQSLSSGEL